MYDFGASWEHTITLVGRTEEDLPPNVITCVSGEGGEVLEDWGLEDWEHLKKLVKPRDENCETKMDKEDKEYLERFEEEQGDLSESKVYNCYTDHINERLTEIDDAMLEDGKEGHWGCDSDFKFNFDTDSE